ncbi:CDP-diacylglycerol--serine O-phosphatidyltransferase [Opitutus sp. ER46]|uniref:CDP-diacylglycerol--serine O-phosphatidyltransferase n=1 Tax=Opitutus sp. ER46 TaxID=2161864 RepID=UPI000D2FD95B|nr:CDP-diacylglycerol--serine O-phosphatidyltransferase [Opitutus sp. ER46]PTX98564.1 CDP-diacylglycerol--serine O-phosphatidyltransferase [Opitutus sp. ER46]
MNFRRPHDPAAASKRDELAAREDPYNVMQASRIYFLPNLMTAGNLFCGFMAIVSCIQARLAETALNFEYRGHSNAEHYRTAVWLIFGAAAFDALDGRLARMGGRESLFGAEFDSLADVVSFGLAPAFLMFYLILSPTQGQPLFRDIGWFIGFVYLLCAAMRLARFNVITNPLLRPGKKDSNKDFVGLPVPAAAATVASLVLLLLDLAQKDRSLQSWAYALPFLMLLVAVLMVSTVRYPSGKNVDLQTRTRPQTFIIMLVVLGLLVLFKEVAVFAACLGYIFFGLIRHVRRSRVAATPTSPANPGSDTPSKTM